jgi:hypothetical protein
VTKGASGPLPPKTQTATARKHRVAENAELARVEAYLAAQTEERRADIEREALEAAPSFLRQNYDAGKAKGGPLFKECRRVIIHHHVINLIETGGPNGNLLGADPPG